MSKKDIKLRLKDLIRDHESWSKEYARRVERMRSLKAYRESAHYEDLLSAHECNAQSLRQIVNRM